MPLPTIVPPLINSANPWATTASDLKTLFDCNYTGAITIRTSLLQGFDHNSEVHQHVFFQPSDHSLNPKDVQDGTVASDYGGSLNTLGYSPITLKEYLAMLNSIVGESDISRSKVRTEKPIIISVTGSAKDICECYEAIITAQSNINVPLCMEINLSCPNIPDKPPPAYSGPALTEYFNSLTGLNLSADSRRVPVGIKTPPYTYHDQFKTLIESLHQASQPTCPIDFITAVNTLGSSLLLTDINGGPALNSATGTGIGGMAGTPLHPLALGNVKTLRTMFDADEKLKNIDIIGIGGVSDQAGFERMKAVGAKVVGVGTAFGREGVSVFEKILGS
ncbi:Hypothetical protein R9X50_00252700 [Acrodontium crateriforme]|uniref:Dihydroorotate dehydrogenase (fumarate) n=1 Tax=Acrodontium crateriforme TaxID=150365 RepID=A0AAQ3M1E8_9PEZI|nr:Hypothetical protein R9X50_00252700 [Acrodontium crateriforme]